MSTPAIGAIFRLRDQASAIADGAGLATITFQPPAGQYWLVERIKVNGTTAVGIRATVYVGAVAPENYEDDTTTMPDSSDYPIGIYVPAATLLLVQVTGGVAGGLYSAGFQGVSYQAG